MVVVLPMAEMEAGNVRLENYKKKKKKQKKRKVSLFFKREKEK